MMTMTYNKGPGIVSLIIIARFGELLESLDAPCELHMFLLASIYLNSEYLRANPISSALLLEFAALADVFLEASPQTHQDTSTSQFSE